MEVIIEILTYLSILIGLAVIVSGSMEIGRRYFAKKGISLIKKFNSIPSEDLYKQRNEGKYFGDYFSQSLIDHILDNVSVSDIQEIEDLENVLKVMKQIRKNQRG